jgi:toxin ParE1/3/4
MRVRIRPRAWLDIEETMGYLKEEAGGAMAIRFYGCVRKTMRTLAKQPGMGMTRLDLEPPGIRSWRVQRPFVKWLIFYRTAEDGLEVLRIKHGSMDIPSLFEN